MQVAVAAGWLQIGRIGLFAVEPGVQRQALDDEREVGEVRLNEAEVIVPHITRCVVVISHESQLPALVVDTPRCANRDVKLFEAGRFGFDLLSAMNYFERRLVFS